MVADARRLIVHGRLKRIYIGLQIFQKACGQFVRDELASRRLGIGSRARHVQLSARRIIG